MTYGSRTLLKSTNMAGQSLNPNSKSVREHPYSLSRLTAFKMPEMSPDDKCQAAIFLNRFALLLANDGVVEIKIFSAS
jgi:hypothetical protein